MDNLIGQRLGVYEITNVIGKGGMATVYRAHQTVLGRDVAVKVIQNMGSDPARYGARFVREARTVATLSHPHILPVYDFGQEADFSYLVMKLIEGGDLGGLIRQGPLPLDKAAKLLDQVASALDYAHQRGVVHRDIKPGNILLDDEGNAVLTDFSIAQITNDSTSLTQTGVIIGTPAYMPPEQWQGTPIDSRTDIYALGVVLFDMLAGRTPFQGETPAMLMYSTRFGPRFGAGNCKETGPV